MHIETDTYINNYFYIYLFILVFSIASKHYNVHCHLTHFHMELLLNGEKPGSRSLEIIPLFLSLYIDII